MAYASLPHVKSRGGRLAGAWTETSTPGDADIEVFLDQIAGEIDAALAGHGIGLPLDAAGVPARALEGLNADGALVLAIEGSWPGGRGNDEVKAIYDSAKARYNTAWTALQSGKHVAVVLAIDTEGEAGAGDGDNFWSAEPDYLMSPPQGWPFVNPALQPSIGRNSKF